LTGWRASGKAAECASCAASSPASPSTGCTGGCIGRLLEFKVGPHNKSEHGEQSTWCLVRRVRVSGQLWFLFGAPAGRTAVVRTHEELHSLQVQFLREALRKAVARRLYNKQSSDKNAGYLRPSESSNRSTAPTRFGTPQTNPALDKLPKNRLLLVARPTTMQIKYRTMVVSSISRGASKTTCSPLS
jgi:hypothetical protein